MARNSSSVKIRELVDTKFVALIPLVIEVLNEFQVFLENFKPHLFLRLIAINLRELDHPVLVVISNGCLLKNDTGCSLRDPKIHGKNS